MDAEQAVGYHGFVLDLGLAVVACLARSGRPVPDELARPLAGIAGFVGTLASDGWTLPRIGDEDDGLGVDLGAAPDERDRLRSRLRSTRALLGAGLPRLDPGIDEATVWLAGAGRAAEAAAAPATVPGSAVFPHGGYAVLRTRDDRGELRAVLDAGPMGLEPMAAHGHADLLAVCLAVDGDEALIDPGHVHLLRGGALAALRPLHRGALHRHDRRPRPRRAGRALPVAQPPRRGAGGGDVHGRPHRGRRRTTTPTPRCATAAASRWRAAR